MGKYKDEANIALRVGLRRHQQTLKREIRKRKQRRVAHEHYLLLKKDFKSTFDEDKISYDKLLARWLPPNLLYLITSEPSDFHLNNLRLNVPRINGTIKIPRHFSIIDHPKEAYRFLQQLTALLIIQPFRKVEIDYADCERLDLGAQVFLDVILKEIIIFYDKCARLKETKAYAYVTSIGGINVHNDEIRKLLFSVGSPAIHSNKILPYKDIVKYSLCIHNREADGNPVKIREQKDLDTTNLVDYVLECLERLNRTLTPETIDDLSTVIGEVLINAEEHSTTKHRFSIGYFEDINKDGKHFGVFRLAIMNFGKTIYEKFKDPECLNKNTVNKMRSLSSEYTKKRFFSQSFEEETLWSLYALQEGVTSIAPERYKRRGNGSIQFIESFFNLKGDTNSNDNFSQLTILSGRTNITFDGTYKITQGEVNGEPYRFMTFNNSGNIDDKPDSNYVKFVNNYFPGTIISAKIIFSESENSN